MGRRPYVTGVCSCVYEFESALTFESLYPPRMTEFRIRSIPDRATTDIDENRLWRWSSNQLSDLLLGNR